MRLTLGAAALISLAVFSAGSPASAKTRSTTMCTKPTHATSTRANRDIVLYRRVLRSTNGERILYWACLRATGKRTRLTEATGKADAAPISNSTFRNSRGFVAYVQTRADHSGGAALYLYSFDLRSGRRGPGIPAAGIPVGGWLLRPDGTHTFAITALAVSDAGGLAWRETGQRTPNAAAADTIMVHDATGTKTVQVTPAGALQGPSISGDTVKWQASGAPKSYRLKN